MKILLKIVLIFHVIFGHQITTAQKHPNIIVFMVDDMGWQDTSVPFYKETTLQNKKFHTPSMERLAAKGTKFTQAYAHTVCTPSRVSLQTGVNPANHKITNWTNFNENKPTDEPYAGLRLPNWNFNGLSPIPNLENTFYATPLAQILKENGYYTIHVGKSHLASFPTLGSNPSNLGFNLNIAGSAVGGPKSYLGTDNFGNAQKGGYTPAAIPDLEFYHGQDIFLSEALTLEAKKALDNAKLLNKPFFLHLSHYAVHAQYKPDMRFYPKYIKEGLSEKEAQYASLVEGMDKSLGDILDYLEQQQLAENTIILFMSDNGGLALTPPRDGKPFTQNLPLKAGKGSAYEGGIREPMIVYWPKVTKANTVNNQYLIIEDFFPTILQMAKIKNYNTAQKIDGKSFVPFLKNNNLSDTTRTLIWHYPNNWEEGSRRAKEYNIKAETQGMGPYSAIRNGDWKLIYFYGIQKAELYNLKTDIGETNNLVNTFKSKAIELINKLSLKLTSENAQFPIDINTGKMITPNIN